MDKSIEEKEPLKNPEEVEPTNPQEPSSDEAQTIADLEAKNSDLYARAKKAEEAKKEAKAELETLQANIPSEDETVYSDEGEALKKEISSLKNRLDSREEEQQIEKVITQYPDLKDKLEEFNEFRKEYPSNKMQSAAKLFLIENDMLGSTPTRRGLEKSTGGDRTPKSSGMSTEEVARLRTTDFRRYQKMLQAGTLKIKNEKIGKDGI